MDSPLRIEEEICDECFKEQQMKLIEKKLDFKKEEKLPFVKCLVFGYDLTNDYCLCKKHLQKLMEQL